MEKKNIIRAFGQVRAESIDVENRTVEFIISDETRDRHGTIIKIGAWRTDNYANNPIVAYQHETGTWWKEEQNPDYILGPGMVRTENDALIGVAKFETADINPLADKIFRKIQFGTLRATSVGFEPLDGHWGKIEDGEDSGTYYYTDVDLMEFSVVNIPSNPNAVARNFQDNVLPPKEEKKVAKSEDTSVADTDKPSGSLSVMKARILLLKLKHVS